MRKTVYKTQLLNTENLTIMSNKKLNSFSKFSFKYFKLNFFFPKLKTLKNIT